MLTRSTITIRPAPWRSSQRGIDMVMSGTFRGQGLRPWALCDPPSPKRTDLQGIVISPVMALSDQDKPFHAALALSLSCYCGHVNSHFHHNCPWFWLYCSAGPNLSLFFGALTPSPFPSRRFSPLCLNFLVASLLCVLLEIVSSLGMGFCGEVLNN